MTHLTCRRSRTTAVFPHRNPATARATARNETADRPSSTKTVKNHAKCMSTWVTQCFMTNSLTSASQRKHIQRTHGRSWRLSHHGKHERMPKIIAPNGGHIETHRCLFHPAETPEAPLMATIRENQPRIHPSDGGQAETIVLFDPEWRRNSAAEPRSQSGSLNPRCSLHLHRSRSSARELECPAIGKSARTRTAPTGRAPALNGTLPATDRRITWLLLPDALIRIGPGYPIFLPGSLPIAVLVADVMNHVFPGWRQNRVRGIGCRPREPDGRAMIRRRGCVDDRNQDGRRSRRECQEATPGGAAETRFVKGMSVFRARIESAAPQRARRSPLVPPGSVRHIPGENQGAAESCRIDRRYMRSRTPFPVSHRMRP